MRPYSDADHAQYGRSDFRRPLTRPIVDTSVYDDDDDGSPLERKCKTECQKAFMCLLIAVFLCTSVTFAVLWRLEVGKNVNQINGAENLAVRRALIDLFFSTNSNRSWTSCDASDCSEQRCQNRVRWVSQEHYCTWKCVQCDDKQQLTDLFLANTGMSGTVPASLTWIESLHTLDVSGNAKLAGTLPGALGALGALQALAFNGTRVSGTIPASMTSLKTLRSVAAVGARLSGTLPGPLPPSLTSLMLQGQTGVQRISGTLPAGAWPAESLSLAHNRLSGTLPGGPIGTTYVDLDANAFTGHLPDAYSDGLRVLKISYSGDEPGSGEPGAGAGLSGTLPAGLAKASALQWLELDGNRLSGSLPADVFSSLAQLSVLQMSGNDLRGPIPAAHLPTCGAPNCACDLSANCYDPKTVPAACMGEGGKPEKPCASGGGPKK